MNFNKILKVYKRDWKSIIKNPVAIIIIIGICFLPSLYAWINIQACWNTYENTGTIPVAVVNNDKGILFQDKEINIGNDVVDKLRQNNKILWTFVSTDTANLGLVDGTYYAMIEIPDDFSESFLSVLSDSAKKPQITYKVDTKVNPVAGKITETAKNTLVDQITSNFVSTVNETIFSSLNTVGKSADENRDNIIKLKDSIVNINQNMSAITDSLQTLGSESKNLNEFLGSISMTLPSVQSGLATVGKQNTDNQAALQSAQSTISKSLDNIDLNLSSAQNYNDRIHSLFGNLNESAATANAENIKALLPSANIELDALSRSIDSTIEYLEQCQALDFNSDINRTITSLQNLKTSLNSVKTQLLDMQTQLSDASKTIDALYDYLNKQIPEIEKQLDALDQSLETVIKDLEEFNKPVKNESIAQLIEALKTLQASGLKTTLEQALQQLKNSKDSVEQIVAALNKDIANMISQIDAANSKIDSATEFLTLLKAENDSSKTQISNIIASLKAIGPDVNDEKLQFTNIQQQLNSANDISKNIADTINDDCSAIGKELNSAISLYNAEVKDDISQIGSSLITAAQDASCLIQSAQDLSSQLGRIVQSGQDGAQLTAKISGELDDDLSKFKNTIKQLSNKFELMDNSDITQIIGILQSNPEFMGGFMSNPFTLKSESINAIPNYGSSMAPIYTALALWVGCLILNSILKTKAGYFEGIELLTIREKYFGKMMTFSTLAMVQGLIASMGNLFLLKIYTVNAFLFIVFAVVSSLVFSIITYTLAATLGNVGKALAIVYMILQLAGSGGTYPIQLDPMIFRILQPLFPFTYSVGGFREAIAGPLVGSVILDFVVLFLFAAVFWLFGFFFIRRPLYYRVHKFEAEFNKSGIGE